MSKLLRCGFAAAAIVLSSQGALAQPVNSCPPGQAMQSSDPSGKKITCVSLPDTTSVINMIGDEKAARIAADQRINARIDALAESDIIGTWATTGTTTCLQSSGGFNPGNFSPSFPSGGFTIVSTISGDFSGTTTFYAGNSGRSFGASHIVLSPGSVFGSPPPGFANMNFGGTSVAALDSNFNWSIESDGTLLIDHREPVVQPFTAPPNFVGQTATIDRMPLLAGYVSKDKRTIVFTHKTMSLETSVRNATPPITSPRYCSRMRVLTRLPN
jgi:hypothetical protein